MRSMTGCGRSRTADAGWELTLELRTVNHRFLDIAMRLPRELGFLESTIRTELGHALYRGHVDVFLQVKNHDSASRQIDLDEKLAAAYLAAAEKLSEMGCAAGTLSAGELLRLEGVVQLTDPDIDQTAVTDLCIKACREAAAEVRRMREAEGSMLRQDLTAHLRQVETLRREIAQRAPDVVTQHREVMEKRLETVLTTPVDPARLAQEVALFADKCAIDEELARLESHVRQMENYLCEPEEIGKKMDFLVQEMNREANTIGSKASDAQIAQLVVNLKSEIEELREQVQNVE